MIKIICDFNDRPEDAYYQTFKEFWDEKIRDWSYVVGGFSRHGYSVYEDEEYLFSILQNCEIVFDESEINVIDLQGW